MFPQPNSRASARQRISQPSAHPQTLTASDTPPDVSRFQTLESVDSRFGDFLDRAQYVVGQSADTLRGYRGTYGNFRQFLAARPELSLSAKLCDLEGWLAWNRKRAETAGRPLSKVTINTYYRQLRPFFEDLEYRDGIPSPFRVVPPPALPRVKLPKARTFEECQQILAAAEHLDWPSAFERWRAVAIIGTFLYGGLRKREVLRLRFAHVNLVGTKGVGSIEIIDGKGDTDRVVTIAPELKLILARYLAERARRFPISTDPAGPAFFTSTKTGQAISESTLRRIVKAIRRASGVAFSMHSLRHSFITFMVTESGIGVAQRLAGHKKITTTAIYLSVTDADLRREIQKVSFLRPRHP